MDGLAWFYSIMIEAISAYVSFKYFLRISTTCLLGIILVGSELRRDLSLGDTSVGLGETLTDLGETLHGRNSLWAKPVVTLVRVS